jgi:hypothetical protein
MSKYSQSKQVVYDFSSKAPQKKVFVEYCSIKPQSASFYSRCLNPTGGSNGPKLTTRKKSKVYKQRRLLTDALDYLFITSKLQYVYCKIQHKTFPFKINFITLTLSSVQVHCDKFIKEKLLEPFLRWLLKKGATGYVWKAEVQVNGNIHFHITTNIYIHYSEIRNKWNGLQYNTGYLKPFFDKFGHFDPNSTDVKSVKNVSKAFDYICKYITKVEDGKRLICGHRFGYSRNLANNKFIFETLDKSFDEIYNWIIANTKCKTIYEYVTTHEINLINLNTAPKLLADVISAAIDKPF